MPLSIKEKLTLQRTVKSLLAKIHNIIMDIRERLVTQRELKETLNKLNGDIAKVAKSIYERLVACEFLHETFHRFLTIIIDAYNEVQDVEKIKLPLIEYAKANVDQAQLRSPNTVIAESFNNGRPMQNDDLNDTVF